MEKMYDERIMTSPEQEAEMKRTLEELMNPAPVIAALRARIAELEAALEWIDLYLANQPLDQQAKFLITEKLAAALEGDADGNETG